MIKLIYEHPANIPQNFTLLPVFYYGQITQCSEEIINFNLSMVDIELLDKLAKACVFEVLARSGCAYEKSAMEKKYGVGIDYFKALQQAVDRRKSLIQDSFQAEREKAQQVRPLTLFSK